MRKQENFFSYTRDEKRTQAEIRADKQLLRLPATHTLNRVERLLKGTAHTESIGGLKK